jgi:hypothetical protein
MERIGQQDGGNFQPQYQEDAHFVEMPAKSLTLIDCIYRNYARSLIPSSTAESQQWDI